MIVHLDKFMYYFSYIVLLRNYHLPICTRESSVPLFKLHTLQRPHCSSPVTNHLLEHSFCHRCMDEWSIIKSLAHGPQTIPLNCFSVNLFIFFWRWIHLVHAIQFQTKSNIELMLSSNQIVCRFSFFRFRSLNDFDGDRFGLTFALCWQSSYCHLCQMFLNRSERKLHFRWSVSCCQKKRRTNATSNEQTNN